MTDNIDRIKSDLLKYASPLKYLQDVTKIEDVQIILEETSFLPHTASFTERAYCLLHNIKTIVKCKECNKPAKFRMGEYQSYCSEHTKGYFKLPKKTIPKINQNLPRRVHKKSRKKKKTIPKKIIRILKNRKCMKSYMKKYTVWELTKVLNVPEKLIKKYVHIHKLHVDTQAVSYQEHIISEFLTNKKIFHQNNTHDIIPPKEIDIYIPEYKIAIELNGLYYHSSKFLSKDYHLNKTIACDKLGIRLIHLFENEVMDKRQVVFEYLLRITKKLPKNNINVAHLHVRKISPKRCRKYLSKHILQPVGSAGNYILGALDDNEVLHGVINLRNNQILRYYSETDEIHDLLMFYAKKRLRKLHYSTMICHVDRRLDTPLKGFEIVSTTKPTLFHHNREDVDVYDCGKMITELKLL